LFVFKLKKKSKFFLLNLPSKYTFRDLGEFVLFCLTALDDREEPSGFWFWKWSWDNK